MSKLRLAASGLILYCTICACGIAGAQPDPSADGGQPAAPGATRLVIATTDLTGADRELGKFLTDTLITDLARSTVLQPIERATVQEYVAKLDLSPDRALTAGEVRKLGAASSADRVLVGSYIVRDDQLIVNTRVLDGKTGLVVPGGAMSAAGSRNDMLNVTHRLARQLHKRLTDAELVIEDSATPTPLPAVHTSGVTEVAVNNTAPSVLDDFQILKSQGLIPVNAKANSPLTDADLAALVKNVAKCVTPQSETAVALTQTTGPVTRIRALAAVLKLLVSPDDLANYRTAPPSQMPSDASQMPAWGVPFLAAAVDQGWWPADRQICSKDLATWAFVATILTRLPLHQSPVHVEVAGNSAVPPPASLPDGDSEPYTGLIIDALDFNVERAMGPRIVDESGRVIYPDPGHVPTDDYIQDHGMVSYYTVLADAKRAGKHPLIVHATKVSDVGHDDFTVSNDAGELIREANRRGKFLWKWNVGVLVGAGQRQKDAQNPPPGQ